MGPQAKYDGPANRGAKERLYPMKKLFGDSPEETAVFRGAMSALSAPRLKICSVEPVRFSASKSARQISVSARAGLYELAEYSCDLRNYGPLYIRAVKQS